jgi:hypothetical protein
MTTYPEIPPDMQRALDIIGDPTQFLRMLNGLYAAAEFLEGHGWAKFGLVMFKDDHRVMLSLDGQVEVSTAATDAEVPLEVHELVAGGRRHHA